MSHNDFGPWPKALEIHWHIERVTVFISTIFHHNSFKNNRESGVLQQILRDYRRSAQAAVAKWLSSWLAEQEDRGSIPGLATWIFRDWLSPASKSRYGWKIAKSTLILKTTNQPTEIISLWPWPVTYVLDIYIRLSHCQGPSTSLFLERSDDKWQKNAGCAFSSSVTLIVTLITPPTAPRGDAGGLSREYVLRIPSVS